MSGNPLGQGIGGLLGFNRQNAPSDAITNSYWDTQTSGQATSAGGGIGLTTRQLQGLDPINGVPFSTVTNLGDTTRTIWGGGANGLYPFLKFFFPNGVQAVTGTAYQDAGTTVLAGGTVNLLVNGGAFGGASTGANGYYYVPLQAGTIAAGSRIVAYTDGATGGATTRWRARAPRSTCSMSMGPI